MSRELPCSSKEITSLFVRYPESDLTSVSAQSVMISRLCVAILYVKARCASSVFPKRALKTFVAPMLSIQSVRER